MRFAERLVRAVDWFYRPLVGAVMPRQVFRYAVCGGLNVVLGWGVYFVIYNFLLDKRMVDLGVVAVSAHVASMLLTFPVTLFVGFWLNRHVAFRRSPLPSGVQLLRYLLSVAGAVVVNYVCLKVFVEWCAIWATPSQMLATCITTGYSFFMAKYFTFRNAETD